MKIRFLGATETVTGSKHLLITEKGKQILLDCGLYQGLGKEGDEMNRHLGLNPRELDALILSHGHIDHCGNIPFLVSQGFSGRIFCTPATADVCRILLLDSAHIQENDFRFINKRRKEKGLPDLKPLYTVHDVEKVIGLLKVVPFNTDFKVNDELSFYFSENGHIIGSAAVNINVNESGKFTRLTFTGDIGRYNDPLLKPPAVFQQADYIICESTYGDRLHEPPENASAHILSAIERTCIRNKGRLLMPAFSLGRTQEILFILDSLEKQGRLPEVDVFVDSPLSTRATEVVRAHPESFNDSLKAYLSEDPEPFGFSRLVYIEDKKDSQALNQTTDPCVVISASGMADAGRIKHHLRYCLSESRNTVLFTGFCAPNTLGAKLLNGEKQVKIFGDLFEVKAGIDGLRSLSAHADYKEMIRFLDCQDKKQLKGIFLVHGEAESKNKFREHLLAAGFGNISIPAKGDSVILL